MQFHLLLKGQFTPNLSESVSVMIFDQFNNTWCYTEKMLLQLHFMCIFCIILQMTSALYEKLLKWHLSETEYLKILSPYTWSLSVLHVF